MISFLQYLTEASKRKATFTFGRFQPPTIGHDKLFQQVLKYGRGGDVFVFGSSTHDSKRNPLTPKEKEFWLKKVAPRPIQVVVDPQIKTALHVADFLSKQGYKELVMVIGQDRVKDFERLLTSYNGVEQSNGLFFDFDSIEVKSAGKRDPKATGVVGMSASKLRQFAQDGDFENFKRGVSDQLSDQDKQKLLDDIQN